MPDPIPSRSSAPLDPSDDDLVELSIGDMTTHLGDTDPDRTGPHVAGAGASAEPPALPGYVIEGELGRGGMGVVYKARHVKLNRPAALKMVLGSARADSKEIIRFLAEAEAVAAVRHPHVVGVYEFGEADGRPYLALELCPGGTLADHLKASPGCEPRGSRLDPRAAAELVRKLADGVAAAHALGIVHRDLKPANVLFDDHGEPKVSDFGLAKKGAGANVTQAGAVMGTPAYMSPEQAKGESKFVGPQADVWALGVILYECLTGKRPFAADDDWALLNQIMTTDPAGVRTVKWTVPRDLDLICRKCLAKAPHERYADAVGLADDLDRFLEGKPIMARPAGPMVRSWKWGRRNKPAVLVILTLATRAGVATWQAVRAETEADRANGEATRAGIEATNARIAESEAKASEAKAVDREKKEKTARASAEEVAKFMQRVFAGEGTRGEAGRSRVAAKRRTVEEAMNQAAKTIEGRFGDRPEVEAALRDTIGGTYLELGDYAEARPQIERALAIREKVLGPDHPDTLTSVNSLAVLHRSKGDYTAAEPLYRRALAGREKALGLDHPDTLGSVNNLAILLNARGDGATAVPLLRRALAGREKALGLDHPDTLRSFNNLAAVLFATGDSAAAVPLLRRSLAGQEKALGLNHPDTLTSVHNLAFLLQRMGDRAAAEPLYRRALAGREKSLGPGHPDTLMSVHNLAMLLQGKGDIAAAEPLYRRALAGREKSLSPGHPDTLMSANNLAFLLQGKGDLAAAEPLLWRAMVGQEKALGPDHPQTLASVLNLAALLSEKWDCAAAEPLYRRALGGYEKTHGPDHLNTLQPVAGLGNLYFKTGRYAEAVPLLIRAALGYGRWPEMAQALPPVRTILGLALLEVGKPAEAESHLLAGYEGLSKQKALDQVNRNWLRWATTGLVQMYSSTNQPTKAAEWRAKLAALPPEVAPRPRAAK